MDRGRQPGDLDGCCAGLAFIGVKSGWITLIMSGMRGTTGEWKPVGNVWISNHLGHFGRGKSGVQ